MPNSRRSRPRRGAAPWLPDDRAGDHEPRAEAARRLKTLDRRLRALEETVDAMRPRAERLPPERREVFQERLEARFREILRVRAEIREALASPGGLESIAAACEAVCSRLEAKLDETRFELQQDLLRPGGPRCGG